MKIVSTFTFVLSFIVGLNLLPVDAQVGINTSNPLQMLHINVGNSAYNGIFFEKTGPTVATTYTAEINMYNIDGANQLYLEVNDPNGRIGFGMNGMTAASLSNTNFSPTALNSLSLGTTALRWNNLYLTNAPSVSSDIRLKEHIKRTTYGLDAIMHLNSYQYSYKSDKTKATKIGFLAQELKQVIPEIVVGEESDNSFLSVRYTEMIPVLVNAIKEQQAIIDSQKKELEQLKEHTSQILKRLDILENDKLIVVTNN